MFAAKAVECDVPSSVAAARSRMSPERCHCSFRHSIKGLNHVQVVPVSGIDWRLNARNYDIRVVFGVGPRDRIVLRGWTLLRGCVLVCRWLRVLHRGRLPVRRL